MCLNRQLPASASEGRSRWRRRCQWHAQRVPKRRETGCRMPGSPGRRSAGGGGHAPRSHIAHKRNKDSELELEEG